MGSRRERRRAHGVAQVATVDDAVRDADAVVLVTEWPELAEVDWTARRGRDAQPVFVDGRNMLDPTAMRAAGFTLRRHRAGRLDRLA